MSIIIALSVGQEWMVKIMADELIDLLYKNNVRCDVGVESLAEDIRAIFKDKSGWVSVKDRLPKKKGEYLVTYHPCYWDSVYPELWVGLDTFRGKSTWAKKKYQQVVAWMPKPKPYKRGE